MQAGKSGANITGQPVTAASEKRPENELTAAAVADTTRPAVTHPSRWATALLRSAILTRPHSRGASSPPVPGGGSPHSPGVGGAVRAQAPSASRLAPRPYASGRPCSGTGRRDLFVPIEAWRYPLPFLRKAKMIWIELVGWCLTAGGTAPGPTRRPRRARPELEGMEVEVQSATKPIEPLPPPPDRPIRHS